MNQQQKKEYILRNWKLSGGKRIAEMLKRYWKKESIETFAKKLFKEKTGELNQS